MKKCEKNTINRWGILLQITLVKLKLYITEKCPPKNKYFTVSFAGKTPLKFKNVPKNQTISIQYLQQAQLALVLLLLACYCGSTTMCRRNGNCVDPNQTDS